MTKSKISAHFVEKCGFYGILKIDRNWPKIGKNVYFSKKAILVLKISWLMWLYLFSGLDSHSPYYCLSFYQNWKIFHNGGKSTDPSKMAFLKTFKPICTFSKYFSPKWERIWLFHILGIKIDWISLVCGKIQTFKFWGLGTKPSWTWLQPENTLTLPRFIRLNQNYKFNFFGFSGTSRAT